MTRERDQSHPLALMEDRMHESTVHSVTGLGSNTVGTTPNRPGNIGLRKGKNTKKLSLSTAAAQKLGPSIHISDCSQGHPKSATPLSRRMPMKLPALDLGLVRRPSLPLMVGKEPPATPLDRTFSMLKDIKSHGVSEMSKECNAVGAYRSGPVCVLSPNLWLYSEPTAEEIRQFDVVINVAKEISNPLISDGSAIKHDQSDPEEWHRPPDLSTHTSPDSSDVSPQELWNLQLERNESSTTLPNISTHDGIEYVHMPWGHNQALQDDLPSLTTFIDKRLNTSRKRVLIHCQQGVSRSASLVIAYIMKTQSLDINDAYSYVKAKSASIGPNMSLIYQLCEWGKTLQRPNAERLQRRSFDVSGAKTASVVLDQDFQSQQRRRATSSAERASLGRTQSDLSLPSRSTFQKFTGSTNDG